MEKSMSPVGVDSSSFLGEAAEESPSRILVQVEERVEIRVGRPGSSSEPEAELIAQSVSLSGEKLQLLRPRRRQAEVRSEQES